MASRRILILEDDLSVASIYATVLRNNGNDVTVCTNFEEARATLRRSLPDAVLTDVRVGEYNGLQLGILFRSLSPEGLIVVVSGHDDPVIRQEAGKLRAEFLVKPVDLNLLRDHFPAPADPPV